MLADALVAQGQNHAEEGKDDGVTGSRGQVCFDASE